MVCSWELVLNVELGAEFRGMAVLWMSVIQADDASGFQDAPIKKGTFQRLSRLTWTADRELVSAGDFHGLITITIMRSCC